MPVVNRPITDEMLKEAQALIGKPVDRRRQQWNESGEVTRDAIRHFVWGVGDNNPLWLSEAYAKGSPVGMLTAPGTFLYSIDSTAIFPGLQGLARLFAGNEWEWFERVRLGDRITADIAYTGFRDVIGKKAGRMILQTGEVVYRNQTGKVVAKAISKCWRTVRTEVEGGLNYPQRTHRYPPEELQRIRRSALSEQIRGAEPRYWEDVAVGARLGPLVKGPLTLTDMICWYCGAGPHGRRPHRLHWKEVEDNPDFYYKVEETGSLEFSERGHYDMYMARELGMPGPYDNGFQRTSWLAHLVTDWMGDAGFLKTLSSRLPLPNVFGDTTWVAGTVVDKARGDDGIPIVAVDIQATNQLGEVTTTGRATVVLPTKTS